MTTPLATLPVWHPGGSASPTLSPQSQQRRLQSITAGRNQGKMLVPAKCDPWISPLNAAEPRAAPPSMKEVPNLSSWMAILGQDEGGRGFCTGMWERRTPSRNPVQQLETPGDHTCPQCAPGCPCPCKRRGTRPGWVVCFIPFLHLAGLPTAMGPYSLPGGCA